MQNNDKKNTFFNLFPNNQPPNQGFSLGTGNKDSSSGLFGNTSNFGSGQSGTGGGLFGTNTGLGSQMNTGSNFMGNQGPAPSTNMGQTGGLFNTPGTGLSGTTGTTPFGLPNAANTNNSFLGTQGVGANQTANTAGSVFGTTGSGLFGSQAANQSTSASGGLGVGPFGAQRAGASSQPNNTGLFGAPNQNGAGAGLFKTQTQPSAVTTGLYGMQPQATAPSGSVFGGVPQNTVGTGPLSAQQGATPYGTQAQGITGTAVCGPAQPAVAANSGGIAGTSALGGHNAGATVQQPLSGGPLGATTAQPIDAFGRATIHPGSIDGNVFGSKDAPAPSTTGTNLFSASKPVAAQPSMAPQSAAAAQQPLGTSAHAAAEMVDGNTYVDITSVPLNFRQKSFNEILAEISAELEKDVKFFKKKAEEVFAQDEKIIRARNNYVKLLDRLKAEEDKINELEENVEFLFKWLESMKIDDSVKYLNELEQCYDEFMDGVMQQKNIEDEIAGIINENMKLISIIDEDLECMESMK